MILANIINPGATSKTEQKNLLDGVVSEETQSLENGFMAILDGELNQQEESSGNGNKSEAQLAEKTLEILTPVQVKAQGENQQVSQLASSEVPKDKTTNEFLNSLLQKNASGEVVASPNVKSESIQNQENQQGHHGQKLSLFAQKTTSENSAMPGVAPGLDSEEVPKMISGDDFLTQRSLFKNTKKPDGGQLTQTLNTDIFSPESVESEVAPMVRGKFAMNEYKGQGDLLQKNLIKPQAEALKMIDGQQLQINPLVTSDKSLGGMEKLMPEVMAGPEHGLTMNSQSSQGVSTNFGAESAQKVVSFSNLDHTSTNKLITQISEYIDRAKFENTKTVDMVVRHEQLGEINIQAQKAKAGSDLIEMKIQTSTPEGMKFFQTNEVDLLKSLSQNGVRLSDFKLSMTTETQNSSSSGFDKDSSQSNGQSKFGDSTGARDQQGKDSERRRQLWNEFQERASA